jgi:hypothetical protein
MATADPAEVLERLEDTRATAHLLSKLKHAQATTRAALAAAQPSSRFRNASCLYDDEPPNLTTTAFSDGTTYNA